MPFDLRAFAEAELQAKGRDLVLSGPYRWGTADSPAVGAYIVRPLPPAERLVFFLGTDRELNGLKSSTLVLIDERGPEVILMTSAGDEG